MAERLDLYATLGLNRSSRDLDIKRAYRKLALQNHPDKGKGTEAEFVAIGFAYHVLSNPKLRAGFDMNEVEFAVTRRQLVQDFDLARALETFDVFFGTANPFAAVSDGVNKLFDATEAARQPGAPAAIELPLVCTLEDLYNSVTKSVAVQKQRAGNDGKPEAFTKVFSIAVEPSWRSGTKLVYDREPGDLTGDVVLTVEVPPAPLPARRAPRLPPSAHAPPRRATTHAPRA
jgi:curved DNA-binding protein CbpA